MVPTEELACRRPELWHISHSLERAVSNSGRQVFGASPSRGARCTATGWFQIVFPGMIGSYAHRKHTSEQRRLGLLRQDTRAITSHLFGQTVFDSWTGG